MLSKNEKETNRKKAIIKNLSKPQSFLYSYQAEYRDRITISKQIM